MKARHAAWSRPAFVAGIGIAALAASTSVQAGWQATASKAYELDQATQLGTLPDTAPLHIVVALKLQDKAALDDFLARSHTLGDRSYGATLSGAEFVARYAPSLRQVQTVTDYLQRAGFSNIEVAANRLLVTADAPPSAVETAFATRLRQFGYGGRTVFANVADALVPDTLGDVVLSVLGLQNADHARPALAYPDARAQASVTGHSPTAFASIYDAAGVSTGSGTTVGIVTDGDLTQTVADLMAFEHQTGLSPALQFVPAEKNGTDTSGLDEWDLDSQSVLGISGGVGTLVFYNAASLNDPDLTVAYNNAVVQGRAKAINVSLGICEKSAYSDGAMAADDVIFSQAMAQGQTFFAASGDGGANTGCSGQKGLFKQVSYPASSPYVVAVGGTTLSTNGNTWAGETAWSGSGGGVSVYEKKPGWQSFTSSAYREVPDVAMDADPNSGALVIVSGSSTQVGGTSLATPLSTGTWARVESAHGGTLTFAAPLIYAAAKKTPLPFHDVTSGSNAPLLGLGGYKAGPGYDEVTGWGTFDVAAFSAVVGQ
ncbi:MAG: S53 family peptidase [Nevskia sp.]|nr:S53 family peptidase [Nevskia sp.]